VQWACQCEADLFVVKHVGRWCSLDYLELYLQEADEIARGKRMRKKKNGKDPAFDFWILDSDTQWDAVTFK
jgi:hypothetical protein